jgi:hypothetical protein
VKDELKDSMHDIVVAHQRKDIGGCICGWGVDTGKMGQSHSLHVIEELEPLMDAEINTLKRAIIGIVKMGVENMALARGRIQQASGLMLMMGVEQEAFGMVAQMLDQVLVDWDEPVDGPTTDK